MMSSSTATAWLGHTKGEARWQAYRDFQSSFVVSVGIGGEGGRRWTGMEARPFSEVDGGEDRSTFDLTGLTSGTDEEGLAGGDGHCCTGAVMASSRSSDVSSHKHGL